MIGALLLCVASTQIVAEVSDDLSTVHVVVTERVVATGTVTIVLAADRYRAPPSDLPPTAETELFAGRFVPGGFENVEVTIDGRACAPRREQVPDGEVFMHCAADGTVTVRTDATLKVPTRYGPFSRWASQLTLGAGWYPYLSTPGEPVRRRDFVVSLDVPARRIVTVGPHVLDAEPTRKKRHIELTGRRHVPLMVLPVSAEMRRVADGRAEFYSRRLALKDEPHIERLAEQLELGMTSLIAFLEATGWPVPTKASPIVMIEAPLRHDLARAADGVVLVSDRAFRLTPLDRFLQFHQFPILREALVTMTLARLASDDPLAVVGADAVAMWLLDRYVAERFGESEDAFDVLSLWSFIPAVDSMLYAPQFPFVGAYFRLIRETDALRANLLDFPSPYPRGKLIYEKLNDRVGKKETEVAMRAIGEGTDVKAALRVALCDDTDAFLDTWLGPYPAVQYRIADYGSTPEATCAPCERATVTVERTGETIAEPIELLLVDRAGGERRVKVPASREVLRTVTATMAAPLEEVVLDPRGRLAEAPSATIPSPKFDNRTAPRWRFLLNNFNLLFSPTAQTIDTAIDIGFSRVRDVRWRFAARASFAPEAVSASTRGVRYFGAPLTPDRLSQWLGLAVAGSYLRPQFAGEAEDAFATSATLFYGWDTRRTVWVAESGEALRLSVAYDRLFGALPEEDVTRNAVSFAVRGLKAWRFESAYQFSLRGKIGAFALGRPRSQLLYAIGGRTNLRGYVIDDDVGRVRGIASAEFLHPILWDLDDNVFEMFWATKVDGAFFADVAVIGDDVSDAFTRPRADLGYGFRIYLDYFGVRPGVMAVDISVPLIDESGRFEVGPPQVHIDFAQSFFVF